MILFLYSPDARDVAFFSPSCRRLSSVCVLCVCWGFIQSLPCTISFPTLFFGGGWEPNHYFTFAFVHPFLFFFLFLISRLPRLSICFISVNFNSPLFCFSLVPYIFFLYLLCGRVRLIYIYIHILLCVCVCCILSLGRKKKKSNNFFGHILFSFPGGIYYYILKFYTQFIFISQLNSQIKIIDNKEKRKKREKKQYKIDIRNVPAPFLILST